MEKLTLLKFSAEWCQPCKKYNPILEKVVDSRDDVILEQVDIDNDPDRAAKYGVKGVPFTVLQDSAGTPLGAFSGAASAKEVNAFIDTIKRGL